MGLRTCSAMPLSPKKTPSDDNNNQPLKDDEYIDKTWSLPLDTWQVCVFGTYWTSRGGGSGESNMSPKTNFCFALKPVCDKIID